MSIIGAKGGAAAVYEIGHSLRLRAAASASLSTTGFTSGGVPNKLTFSTRIKRGKLGYQALVVTYSDVNNIGAFYINGNDRIQYYNWQAGAFTVNKESVAVFRDLSAHYHFVLIIDTTLATAENRFQIWVNGVRITSWTTNTNTHAQNAGQMIGYAAGGVTQRIGANPDGTTFNDAYFSDIHYLWANKAAASDFGQLDENGVWVPKKPTGITYGAYGAHLDFSNGSSTTTLGYDKNGVNNWTCNNISLTAGATYDWMTDTPTNNFCTLNQLYPGESGVGAALVSDGALLHTGSAATTKFSEASIYLSRGKYYWEATYTAASATTSYVAVYDRVNGATQYRLDGTIHKNGTLQGTYATYTTNDVIAVAVDVDAKTISYYKNGVLQTTLTSVAMGATVFPFFYTNSSDKYAVNFGQRPFAYTPPAGFKALCTANLTAVTIANPMKHFDIHTRTGTGTTANITGKLLSPDLVWIKNRGASGSNHIADSLRGVANQLFSDATSAEASRPLSLTAFNSDGYSLGNGSDGNVNTNTNTYVDWLWKANGAGVSNTDGSITSTVSANQAAGFSIVTFSGAGSAGTIGHGLGVTPDMLIFKSRDNVGTTGWNIWHKSLTSSTHYLSFTTAAQSNSASNFSGTWNSSVFGLTATPLTIGADLVAYCFAETLGYSKIGSYPGNGSADGPFVWCGFRPKFVMVKRTDAAGNWVLLDTARNPTNTAPLVVFPNLSNAEGGYAYGFDVLANGFKLREPANSDINLNGATYIFMAFAEHPFGGSNVSPAPAR